MVWGWFYKIYKKYLERLKWKLGEAMKANLRDTFNIVLFLV